MIPITTLNRPNFIQTDSYQAPTPTTSIPLIQNYMPLALGDGELCSNPYIFGILTCMYVRRCPGSDLAMNTLFIMIATLLTLFEITPEVDGDGRPQLPGELYRETLTW